MLAGARHALAHPPAAAALLAISLHRLCYGFLTLMTLLLYRNAFEHSGGPFPGGLVGLSEVIGAGALGTLLAAAVTPWVVRRIGKVRWTTVLLAGGGIAQLALGLLFVPPAVVAAAFVLGYMAQAVKICVDTTLQESVDDDFRGRVFSVYDTLFNVTFVVAVLVGAFVLPPSGISYAVLAGVGAGYLLTAVVYARITRRH
jgi:MFS family permease